MGHCRALHTAINKPSRDWKRRRGRPAHRLPGPELDLKSCDIGLHSACLVSRAEPKCMEQSCADNYAPVSLGSALDGVERSDA